MCQVDGDCSDLLQAHEENSVSKKCMKCKEATASVVIRVRDTYCRGCFKEYFIHKFRAMLGKNRIIFPGEKVLLAVSGGPSSCSMLRQVQEGLSQNAHKKLRFSPGIVFIDEGGAVGQSLEDRRRKKAELQDIFKDTGFPVHMVSLEQVLDLPGSVLTLTPPPSDPPAASYKAAVDHFIQTGQSPTGPGPGLEVQEDQQSPPEVQESQTQRLQQLLDSARTLTARNDLLNTLRLHVLVHVARTEGYSKVMLGENCSRLAVKLLTSISLGRGAQLAHDTGFSDSRFGDVILVRPMRDYAAKEIAFYNHIFNVKTVFIPSLDTKMTNKSSIQRLTESFITKLQADFPSTVSTIYRTSEKLQVSSQTSSQSIQEDRCLLCMSSLDTAGDEASAFRATLISEQLSEKPGLGPDPDSTGRDCCSAGAKDCGKAGSGGGCCSDTKASEKLDLKTLLCYSCQLTLKDMSSVDHLPLYIQSEAQRRHRRCQMREQISDFLLDGDHEEEMK